MSGGKSAAQSSDYGWAGWTKKTLAQAAKAHSQLGELLALFVAVRGGSARERALAMSMLDDRLSG